MNPQVQMPPKHIHTGTYIYVPIHMSHIYTYTQLQTHTFPQLQQFPWGLEGRSQVADRTHYCLPLLLLMPWQLLWVLKAILKNSHWQQGSLQIIPGLWITPWLDFCGWALESDRSPLESEVWVRAPCCVKLTRQVTFPNLSSVKWW